MCNMESLLFDLPGNDCPEDMAIDEVVDCISEYNYIEKTGCFDLDMDELRLFFDKLVSPLISISLGTYLFLCLFFQLRPT